MSYDESQQRQVRALGGDDTDAYADNGDHLEPVASIPHFASKDKADKLEYAVGKGSLRAIELIAVRIRTVRGLEPNQRMRPRGFSDDELHIVTHVNGRDLSQRRFK